MNKPTLKKICTALLCSLVILSACQKEDKTVQQQSTTDATSSIRSGGVVPDDPAKLATIPVIVSSDFMKIESQAARKGGGKTTTVKDTDGDGIPDTSDTCPTQPETFNGYQDNDGCPDTAPTPPPGGDATAPTISITSPANGATVSGTVNITVNASDNVGVSSVNYTLDGSSIGTASSAPFTISWNTTSAADGVHTLSARAYDAAGNSSISSISITKNTTVLPPPSNFPSSFSLVMPPVQNQGAEFACVAFATTYAARSVEQYYRTNASSYNLATNIFSPEFVYNQTKIGSCGSGTSLTTALDFIKSNGVCTWQSMPYSADNGCSLMPTSAQSSEAANYKIASYSWLYESDQTAIKTMLTNKHAIIITVDPDDSFWNATPGFIWKAYTGNKTMSHAIVICGYDDAKHAYKVMNSWGTGWGDAGFSWIDYDFLPYTGSGVGYVMNY